MNYDNRIDITVDQLYSLCLSDLKLFIKTLCILRCYIQTDNEEIDTDFRQILKNNEEAIKEIIHTYSIELSWMESVSSFNIQSWLTINTFDPPVPNRVCIMAKNGMFMDKFAMFSTREIPLNSVMPFGNKRGSQNILEHVHEAVELTLLLRMEQVQELATHKYSLDTNMIIKLKNLNDLMFQIGKTIYHHRLNYEHE